MSRRVLTEEEVTSALAARGGSEWHVIEGMLSRTVVAGTFVEAITLVDRVAVLAESADHHPDIDIRYRRVTFSLTTHDSGGITRADLDLAAAIDGAVIEVVAR